MMKNEFGQLQAKLNLNIEAEPAPAAAPAGQAPTFMEKPKIVTQEDGKLIMMIVRYRAESKAECTWSFKETTITETRIMKIVHERVQDFWESRVQLTVDKMCTLDIPQPVFWSLNTTHSPFPHFRCSPLYNLFTSLLLCSDYYPHILFHPVCPDTH
jgi:hypothetical protein